MEGDDGSQAIQEQPVATRTRKVKLTSTRSLRAKNSINRERDAINELLKISGNGYSSDISEHEITISELVSILEKEKSNRSVEENSVLTKWNILVPLAKARIRSKKARRVLKQRATEQEESPECIEKKVESLAELFTEARNIVVYTGAGISTSASIPDYRGPNGLWTQIRKKGTFSIAQHQDISLAEPTLTHMAIHELCRRRVVSHVVSQNCDGLHLRSGIPQSRLSEIHGNMFIEVCPTCEKQYIRQADVTDKTSRFRHKTGRKCHTCTEPNNNLIDTIVLFGERNRTLMPMNWDRANRAASRANLIICMGSSLKTLVRYHSLWPKRGRKWSSDGPDTKLVIINLQYTSKDNSAVLKIRGKCDIVMELLMKKLNINIPNYDWSKDPLLQIAIPFSSEERKNLKRNLIFETKALQSSSDSVELKIEPISIHEDSCETELSEPSNMQVKMEIVETKHGDSIYGQGTPSSSLPENSNMISKNKTTKIEMEESNKLRYALPGWLGKSIGNRPRKRCGNRGRSH